MMLIAIHSHIRVTAFSIRWLHEAFDSEWREELYMDSDTLSKTAHWITLQQTDEGSFADPTAVLHDRKMNVRYPSMGIYYRI